MLVHSSAFFQSYNPLPLPGTTPIARIGPFADTLASLLENRESTKERKRENRQVEEGNSSVLGNST